MKISMKKQYSLPHLLVASTLLSLSAFSASHAYTLDDNYVGTNHGGWGDVVGSTSTFDLHGFNIVLEGSILSVDIHTNYAGLADNGLYANLTDNTTHGGGNGIGYGDLLLSSSAGTFTHGFALDDRWSATGGVGTLFEANSFLTSDNFVETGHRHGYDVAVDTNNATALSTGSWSVNESGGYLSLSMDLSGTGLLNSNDLFFSWGYTCANDMLIGSVAIADIDTPTPDVPEPGILSLVGLGLLGTLMTRRRRRLAA